MMHDRSGALKARQKLGDAANFLRAWAEKPLQVGSVTPSSRALSRAIASNVDPSRPGPVIEIGPGTGPVTEALVERGISEDRLVLVEYEANFCELLRRRYPAARVVQGDAYTLKQTLAGIVGPGEAAAVVCGLPVIVRPEDIRISLLWQAFELMQPGTFYSQFTYSMVSPYPLKKAGCKVQRMQRVWRNVPPARVYTYARPVMN